MAANRVRALPTADVLPLPLAQLVHDEVLLVALPIPFGWISLNYLQKAAAI